MLRLLVRVEDNLAGRAAHVPDRQRDRQFAALGLGQLSRQHPLPDQVQSCLHNNSWALDRQSAIKRRCQNMRWG
jgi:hypothetical protein